MSAWWWIPIGLAAWCVVAVIAALMIGPVIARGSRGPEQRDDDEGSPQ